MCRRNGTTGCARNGRPRATSGANSSIRCRRRPCAGAASPFLSNQSGVQTMNVKGQAALVTGGGSGLGAGTAKALAAAGAKVALLDVNMDGAEKLAKEIGGIAIKCDVSSAADGEKAVTA